VRLHRALLQCQTQALDDRLSEPYGVRTESWISLTTCHSNRVQATFSALAGELPKEGNYDFTACYSGVNNAITFSKTHTASSFELTGTTRSNPPGGVFDKVAYRCVGSNTSLDGKVTASNLCENIDVDGDKYLTRILTADGKTTRTIVAGTGKYEGIVTTQ